jgi:uncharacterized C2H2 Zn-finger protein
MEGMKMSSEVLAADLVSMRDSLRDPDLAALFGNEKNFSYHINPHHGRLIRDGAIMKAGTKVMVSRSRFLSAWARLQADLIEKHK